MELTTHSTQFFAPLSDQLKNSIIKKNGASAKLQDNLMEKVKSPKALKSDDLQAIANLSNKPEDMLEFCFIREQHAGIDEAEKLWLSGLEKHGSSALYLENMGFHYYQRKQYHKSLEYLNKASRLEKSFFTITLSIAASYSVGQYHLVWDYFNMLDKKDQSRLDDQMINNVATAGLHQSKFEDAGKLLEYLKNKNKLPSLPTLDEMLKDKFKNPRQLNEWVQSTGALMSSKKDRAKLTLGDCITYATALMHADQYEDALNSMLLIKKERY